jgi:hypothetical protein
MLSTKSDTLFFNPITAHKLTLNATSHTTTISATKPFIYSTIRWSIRTLYTPTAERNGDRRGMSKEEMQGASCRRLVRYEGA